MEILSNGEPVVVVASCTGPDTGGGLYAYDGEKVERLDRLSSSGITVADGRFARLLSSTDEVDPVGELLVYDERGVERYARIDGVGDPHDLVWDGQQFLAVASLSNSILWLSAGGEVVRRWQAPGDGDSWHVNGVFLDDGAIYGCAFGRFARHREWTERLDDATGVVFDLETGRDVLSGLDAPHHPRRVDGRWAVCNSRAHEVLGFVDGRVDRRVQLEAWTRGFELADELLFVGESANRKDLQSTGSTAAIVVLARDSWEVCDRVPLPPREISDLALVPRSLLEGIRRGFRTSRPRVAESDQHALFAAAGVEPTRLWATGDPLPREACRVRVEATLPDALEPGQRVEIRCEIENLGSAILVSAPPFPVHCSYRWFDRADGTVLESVPSVRTPLPRSLPPGERVAVSLPVQGPAESGEFVVGVTLVQEEIAWFDDILESNGTAAIVRVDAPLGARPVR
jgi:acetolactate synthase I/II/III large subunit